MKLCDIDSKCRDSELRSSQAMPFGGSGTQAGAPWRASVVRTDAEGGDTLPRADAGTWVGSWTLRAGGQELYIRAACW